MVVFSPCKINLGLHVPAKRPDGYHDIETCFYPIPWYDILEIVPAKTFSLTCTGLSIPGSLENNICTRAYRLLQRDFDLGAVAMYLHKIIPVGAGLGGGSANGVYALKGLNQLFQLNLSYQDTLAYALQLGSDCGYFLHEKPMFGTGRGEQLSPASISLRGKYGVLIYPGFPISSADAYTCVIPTVPEIPLQTLLHNYSIDMWKTHLTNAFEKPMFKKHAILAHIKNTLYEHGALYAGMSGSGATLFGIYAYPVSLHHCFPDMICQSVLLQ